jgi:hypothetical protein
MTRPQLATMVLLLLTSACRAPDDKRVPSTEPVSPISLDELCARGVAGRLGVPLGTFVTVSGVVIPNTSLAKASVSEPFILRVERVAGRHLDPPVEYFSSSFPLSNEATALKIGDRFECRGYETGGFNGWVDDPQDQSAPRVAHSGYGFGVEFRFTKVFEPNSKRP